MRLVIPLERQVHGPGLDRLESRGAGVVEFRGAVDGLVGRVRRQLVQVRTRHGLARRRAKLQLVRHHPVAKVGGRQRQSVGRLLLELRRGAVIHVVALHRIARIKGPYVRRHGFGGGGQGRGPHHAYADIPRPVAAGEGCLRIKGIGLLGHVIGVERVRLRQRVGIVERGGARQRSAVGRVGLAVQALHECQQLGGVQLRQHRRGTSRPRLA